MVERMRRNRQVAPNTTRIELLMKSISTLQDRIAGDNVALKADISALYTEMKTAGLSEHQVDSILAELYRPQGRATNTVDPKGFRALVKDDKDFYSAVSVSITAARKILPEKQLLPITTTTPAKLGEETVRVTKTSD